MTKQINMGTRFNEALIAQEIQNMDDEINQAEEEEFKRIERRMDVIGQNGNDGLVYEKPENNPPSRYHVRNIWSGEEWIDFYMYYDQLKLGKPHEVGDSAIEHALKKLSCAGLRSGKKSKIQDLEEAIWSLQNAVKMIDKAEG